MADQQSSYRQIFKATSIFGGVQVYQILLSIVRTKIVAVLLGAQGMGISGLFMSVTTLISSITGLGISTSAVRNIADANQKGDETAIGRVVAVIKKLALFTGMLGAIVTLVLSPLLSRLTFGDNSYTLPFMALSLTFLLGSLASGQLVLLQGLRKLSYLAKTNIIGATAGLLLSIPLYYAYGLQGIVPAIILSGLASVAVAYYFGAKLAVQGVAVSFKEAWHEGSDMMRMGIMLSLSTIIAGVGAYAVRIFINWQGGMADVGLYGAGFAIVHTYVGMIFTAISTDYYPRLSAIIHDKNAANQLINQQAEMALLILGPILILFLIVLKFAIVILYTAEFLTIINMVQWFVIAILFKAIAWAVGFIFLAKGDSKFFFWNELIANTYLFLLTIAGYYYYGLEGLGVSFLISFCLSVLQNILVCKYRYQFVMKRELLFMFVIILLLGASTACMMRFFQEPIVYFYATPFLLVSIIYSWWQMNKRINFQNYISRFFVK